MFLSNQHHHHHNQQHQRKTQEKNIYALKHIVYVCDLNLKICCIFSNEFEREQHNVSLLKVKNILAIIMEITQCSMETWVDGPLETFPCKRKESFWDNFISLLKSVAEYNSLNKDVLHNQFFWYFKSVFGEKKKINIL